MTKAKTARPAAKTTGRPKPPDAASAKKKKSAEASADKRAVVASEGGRVVLPRWFKQPLQALVGSHLSADSTDNGPHGLAFTLSQAFGDLVSEQLGSSSESAMWKVLGSPYDEASPLVRRLAKALERAFEPHEEGGLRDDIDEAWLVKTFLGAVGIGFSARKVVQLRVLTRPLFEKGVAGVLVSSRGSSTPPRTVGPQDHRGRLGGREEMRLRRGRGPPRGAPEAGPEARGGARAAARRPAALVGAAGSVA
jgi:hypothetical protein